MNRKLKGANEEFDQWLREIMKRQRIKTWSEMAMLLGVNRKTVNDWRKNPSMMKRITLAGIMQICFVFDEELDDLCVRFGVE